MNRHLSQRHRSPDSNGEKYSCGQYDGELDAGVGEDDADLGEPFVEQRRSVAGLVRLEGFVNQTTTTAVPS